MGEQGPNGGKGGAKHASPNGDSENGTHGTTSRRGILPESEVGVNERARRSVKMAPPSDAPLDGG